MTPSDRIVVFGGYGVFGARVSRALAEVGVPVRVGRRHRLRR